MPIEAVFVGGRVEIEGPHDVEACGGPSLRHSRSIPPDEVGDRRDELVLPRDEDDSRTPESVGNHECIVVGSVLARAGTRGCDVPRDSGFCRQRRDGLEWALADGTELIRRKRWVGLGRGPNDEPNKGASAPARCHPCGISEFRSGFPDASTPLICPTGFSAWRMIMILVAPVEVAGGREPPSRGPGRPCVALLTGAKNADPASNARRKGLLGTWIARTPSTASCDCSRWEVVIFMKSGGKALFSSYYSQRIFPA